MPMIKHQERPPTALAHGPTKSNDIERVRRHLQSLARQAAERSASQLSHAAERPRMVAARGGRRLV